ncbi:hypothetical protein BDN70DRAFT_879789 [Pholiota conissans]|uniref:Zn(2)-C6 fungal-type domain-containing protein n=1 Tax=Pholiota conissans TaxID=109636 RepID=A0A9P5YZR0_9AGAR|nr:hypothetical protein BDN70DRAFT_879789 [Pholiota conissans]
MSFSKPSLPFDENVSGCAPPSSGVTSEELHLLLNLPLPYTPHSPPAPSDTPESSLPNSPHLQGYAESIKKREDTEFTTGSASVNAQQKGESSTIINQNIGARSFDERSPKFPFPTYADFSHIFTREEYDAIAICYDLYGFESSRFVFAENIFLTQKTATLDLFGRLQIYDVMHYTQSLEETTAQKTIETPPVSFHYSISSFNEPTELGDVDSSSDQTDYTSRLNQGDLTARLLRANERSLFRRGKAYHGILNWSVKQEIRFQKRHGIASPLNSVPPTIPHDLEEFFKNRTKQRKKSSSSSSSSYGNSSGYHSRSSSFSSERRIPGSMRTESDFPYAYQIDSLQMQPSLTDAHDIPSSSPVNPSTMGSMLPSRPSSPALSKSPTGSRSQKKNKNMRPWRACLQCRSRKVKCSGPLRTGDSDSCWNCIDRSLVCEY